MAAVQKRIEVIRKLGRALEEVAEDTSDVCRQIKTALKEEIGKKLVSGKDIERYCYEKWKKKTKPKKNDKKSIPEEKQEGEAETGAREEAQGDGDSKQEESKELIEETFTIPTAKFEAVIQAIHLSKKGCLLRFNKNYELVSVQAD